MASSILRDAPVAEGPFAHDPHRPVTASHLPTLLASQTPRPVHALGLDTITAGAQQLAARLQALRTPTGAIVVCDAVTDAHLAVIAEAARLLGEGCLLAGSAGLARRSPPFTPNKLPNSRRRISCSSSARFIRLCASNCMNWCARAPPMSSPWI
jgi:uncharacterized protein YgbK (DUF1537 family)